MKKSFLTLLFVLSSIFSFSQFHHYGYMNICEECYTSIEVGGISSNISGYPGATSKMGFYFGIFQFRPLGDGEKFALRTGISYNNIGSKVEGFDTPLVIHSINAPLGLHYRINEKVQVFGGGELGTNLLVKTPQKEILASDLSSYYNSSYYNSTNNGFTSFDASAYLGVGYIFKENIDINLKYNLAMTSINAGDVLERDKWKKSWLTLSVGYTFRDE
jgi:opacity protein-like surface antigen